MARKNDTISALQCDAHGIAWVRLGRSSRGWTLLDHAVVKGDWSGEGMLERAVKDFAVQHGLAEDGRMVSVVPRYEITTRILLLPSHDREELTGMLRFSAEEFVPFSADELIIDHAVLRELPNGESLVFAALAHRDVLERHMAALSGAGLEPEHVYLSTAGLMAAAGAGKSALQQRYALVHLGAGGLEVAVVDQDRLAYSRGLATSQNYEELAANPEMSTGAGLIQENGIDELAAEIRNSLGAFRRESEDGLGVDFVYVACDGAGTELLCPALSKVLGKECQPSWFAASLAEGVQGAAGAPLAALGAACMPQASPGLMIDLLPRKVSEKRKARGTQRLALRIVVFITAVLLALGGWYWQAVHQRTQFLAELENQVSQLEPNARGIAEKREQLNILRRQVDRDGSLIAQLAAVVDAVPEGQVNITQVRLDRETGITLWGRAKTVDNVGEYAQNLRNKAEGALKFFSAAHSLYEQKASEQDQNIFVYQIAIPIEPDEGGAKPAEGLKDVR